MSTATAPEVAADRKGWLARRADFLGSSESPAVLGCGYANENQHTVWLRKLGLIEPLEDNDSLLCGRLMQGGILAVIRHKTGYDIQPADEFGVYRSKEHPWLGATPDSLIHGDRRGLGVCELKNVDHFLLKDWRGPEAPLRVNVQLIHQLLAVGATWGIAAAVIGGNRPAWFEIELSSPSVARLATGMVPHLRKFWEFVESQTPPPIDASAGCSEALKKLYPVDDGTSVDLPPVAAQWFNELRGLKAASAWLEKRKAAIENSIKAAIGDATFGTLPDGRRFSWKSQTSNYAAQEARTITFRVLRQHEPKALKITADAPEDRVSTVTTKLLAMGATLYHESESGSRYFELAGGLRVRVADHPPNEKTAAWIGRHEVAEVRVDLNEWDNMLEAITGPPLLESE